MLTKILFVDDDPLILDAYRRQLRKVYDLHTADGGDSGLEMLKSNGPFAIVVTDMNMPGMNGIEFLTRVRQIAPDSIRIMLTGMADLQVSINAVNEGHIFRFLTKPCDSQVLVKALIAGSMQYRLIMAERELLDKTLTGSVKVLVDILESVNPVASSRTMRIVNYVAQMTKMLGLEPFWQYHIAAMLSQIGCVTVPSEIMEKAVAGMLLNANELDIVKAHPETGKKLIAPIPRLEVVAEMIENQYKPFSQYDPKIDYKRNPGLIGGQLLKLAIDFDILISQDISQPEVCAMLEKRNGAYNPEIVALLEKIKVPAYESVVRMVKAEHLVPGMILAESVFARNDTLVVCGGKELTRTLIQRLRNFVSQVIIPDTFRVKVPLVVSQER